MERCGRGRELELRAEQRVHQSRLDAIDRAADTTIRAGEQDAQREIAQQEAAESRAQADAVARALRRSSPDRFVISDDEIAARATEILRSRGRRDRVRTTQVATYRTVLDAHALPDFLRKLTDEERWEIATLGWPALGEAGSVIDERFVARATRA